jgi:hypothetical protein
MAEKRYNVVFSGKLVEGRKSLEVLAKLCPVLELTEPQVRELFKVGFGAVIAHDVDGQRAYALREELREAGAVCTVQEIEPPPPQEPLSGSMQTMTAPLPDRPAGPPREPRPTRPQQPAQAAGGSGIGGLLFKLVILAGLAGGGWWGYQTWLAPASPAFQAYVTYSEALARGQYQQAADGAAGEAKEYAESLVRMTAPSSLKVYGKEITISRPSVSDIAGEVAWVKRKRQAEQKKDAGSVTLQVEETVCRIPPGVSSALCKWPVTFRHDVEVALVDGVWQVSAFKEERLTPAQ